MAEIKENAYVGDLLNFMEFESLSKIAIYELKNLNEHKAAIESEITDNQNALFSEYTEKAEVKAVRKTRLIRIAVCIAIAVFLIAISIIDNHTQDIRDDMLQEGSFDPINMILAGLVIADVWIALYVLRPGYLDKRMKKARKNFYKDPEYCAKLQIAKIKDQEETEKNREFHKKELDRLTKQGDYGWLHKAWEDTAKSIKANAYGYGIEDLVKKQSDTEIMGVLIRKMPSDSLATTTYGMLIQKAKAKAVSDWQACKREQEKINYMLDQMFR